MVVILLALAIAEQFDGNESVDKVLEKLGLVVVYQLLNEKSF